MSLKQRLLEELPPFSNKTVVIKKRQGTEDIVSEILVAHNEFAPDYELIYENFDTGECYTTCRKIWDFLKQNLIYDEENGKIQSIRSPAAILQPGVHVDCKHYSSFAGGVLDCILLNHNEKWDWCYAFVSDSSRTNVSHVFVVVYDGIKEYWIDPCLSNFNARKNYLLFKEFKPMALVKISGIGEVAPAVKPKTVVVTDKGAFLSFLPMLSQNMFAMKTLMKMYPQITQGPVKQWFINQGYNWNQVEQFMNA